MTDDTTDTIDKTETETETETEAGAEAAVAENDDVLESPAGFDDDVRDDVPDSSAVPGSGALSGGFGFAGLALAVVGLTTNWTSQVAVNHSQYNAEINAGSSGPGAQQQLDLAVSGWHTQAWWSLGFAVAAVLFGVGALLLPRILRKKNNTPGWARAGATGAVIVGIVGVVLAVLTVAGVIGGSLTAPAGAS